MSSNLFWHPVKPVQSHCLGGHPLKGIIARHFWDSDGSITRSDRVTLTEEHLQWLGGIRAALAGNRDEETDGTKQVDELAAAIRKHKAVQIWIEG